MMKVFKYNLLLLIYITVLGTVYSPLNAQSGISFDFANDAIIDSSEKKYFVFDIMASATAPTQFKVAQIHINYNTLAFGTNIVKNGKVNLAFGELLAPVTSGFDVAVYAATLSDNNPSILAIQNTWQKTTGGPATGFELSNTLGTTAKKYVRVTIEIADLNQTSGLNFVNNIDQWDQQDYSFSSGNNTTIYSSVTYGTDLDAPLPVELTLFTAKRDKNGILLKWTTETEVNNYGFEIEGATVKSLSQNPNPEFKFIDFVEGHGNSNSPKEYSYLVRGIKYGNYAYRLKQIDNDGRYEYSNIIEINAGEIPNGFVLEQNYPNPFNPSTTIRFATAESIPVKLSVYDILGNEIDVIFNEVSEAGKVYDINFASGNLASGIYYYRFISGKHSEIKKMVLLK